jgi:hypothetical protein
MSNVIYEYNWRGLKTGWDYKLEIIPAGDTDLNNPAIVKLPPGTINVQKLGLKYDEYLSGFPEAPQLDVFIDLKTLPDDITYADFKKAVYTPLVEIAIPYIAVFDAGTIFNLSIKYNGNADEEINVYRKLFTGCYRREGKYNYDLVENTVTLNVIDINRTIHDTIVWFFFILANQPTNITRTGYIDLAYIKDTINYVIGHHDRDHSFIFSEFTDIELFIAACANAIYKKLVRDATAEYTMDFPFPIFYKQSYTPTGNLGDELTRNDLYFINKVLKGENWIGGLIHDKDELGLPVRYGNSAWDYISELCEFSLAKAIFKPTGLNCIPIFGSVGSENLVTLEVKNLNSMNLNPSNVIKTATSSLYEKLSDDKFSDIEKYEELQVGTQNEGQNTIPVVFNNIPGCVSYSEEGYTFNLNLALSWKRRRAFYPHILNLYYFDQPSFLDQNLSSMPFRVHEYCKWNLGNGIYSDSLPGCSFSAFNAGAFDYDKPSECIAAMQSDSCYPKWMAKTQLAIFGNKDQRTLDIKVDFNENTYFTAGGGVGFPWYQPDTTFIFNLSNISLLIQTDKEKWDMLSTELDFENEEASLALLQRMV